MTRSNNIKQTPSNPVPDRRAYGRSRITNDHGLLPDVDGRSIWARRFRDLVELHIADKGGVLNVSEGTKALIRRASTLIVELERLEAKFAGNGGASADELDRYGRGANTLRRLLLAIGLERRARDITPTRSLTDHVVSAFGAAHAGERL